MRRRGYIVRDGLTMRIGSREHRWYLRNRLNLLGRGRRRKRRKSGHEKRDRVVVEALRLVGISESPPHSNAGGGVHAIQSATGQYNAPWCTSFVQYVWQKALGSTWANRTAGAYYLASYAHDHKATIGRPVAGCAVVYRMGDGHAGVVVAVRRDGRFWAVEGNWGDRVVHILRDPRTIPCTFILRPELR